MRFILLLFILITKLVALCQETKVMEDLELWTGAKYAKILFDKKIELSLESEVRLNNNMSKYSQFFIEPAINYAPYKFIEAGCHFRLSDKTKRNNEKESQYRYGFNVQFKQKIKRFSASYRIKYTNTDIDLFKSETINQTKNVIRNKLQFKYNIKNNPFTPYASNEIFHQINKENQGIYKLRLTLGTTYAVNKKSKIRLYYRADRELNSIHPYTFYIVGLGYDFTN